LAKVLVNDIKSVFMAEKYTREILKYYGEKVDDILINEAIRRVSAFSMIHADVASNLNVLVYFSFIYAFHLGRGGTR